MPLATLNAALNGVSAQLVDIAVVFIGAGSPVETPLSRPAYAAPGGRRSEPLFRVNALVHDATRCLASVTIWGPRVAWVRSRESGSEAGAFPTALGFSMPWQPGDVVLITALAVREWRSTRTLTTTGSSSCVVMARGGEVWSDGAVGAGGGGRSGTEEQQRSRDASALSRICHVADTRGNALVHLRPAIRAFASPAWSAEAFAVIAASRASGWAWGREAAEASASSGRATPRMAAVDASVAAAQEAAAAASSTSRDALDVPGPGVTVQGTIDISGSPSMAVIVADAAGVGAVAGAGAGAGEGEGEAAVGARHLPLLARCRAVYVESAHAGSGAGCPVGAAPLDGSLVLRCLLRGACLRCGAHMHASPDGASCSACAAPGARGSWLRTEASLCGVKAGSAGWTWAPVWALLEATCADWDVALRGGGGGGGGGDGGGGSGGGGGCLEDEASEEARFVTAAEWVHITPRAITMLLAGIEPEWLAGRIAERGSRLPPLHGASTAAGVKAEVLIAALLNALANGDSVIQWTVRISGGD
jgi:hypothetical protein